MGGRMKRYRLNSPKEITEKIEGMKHSILSFAMGIEEKAQYETTWLGRNKRRLIYYAIVGSVFGLFYMLGSTIGMRIMGIFFVINIIVDIWNFLKGVKPW
jgi:hypothetical protein